MINLINNEYKITLTNVCRTDIMKLKHYGGTTVAYFPKEVLTNLTNEERQTIMNNFWSHVKETDPEKCWNWNGESRDYYPRMNVKGRAITAHRVVYELFHGPLPKDLPYVLHSCDNRGCINPNHLRPGTQRDNMIDKRFNKCPLILSERDVKVVKYMKTLKYTDKAIAKMFGCSKNKIYDIRHNINTAGVLPENYHSFRSLSKEHQDFKLNAKLC